MSRLHCAARDVEKPAYKDQAYIELLDVGFTSKYKCIAMNLRGVNLLYVRRGESHVFVGFHIFTK